MEIILILAVLAALLLFLAIRQLRRARKADEARLVSERAEVRWKKQYARTDPDLRAYIDYTVCFRTEDGELYECKVEQYVYHNLSEGDCGVLKHRGAQFRSFLLENGKQLSE